MEHVSVEYQDTIAFVTLNTPGEKVNKLDHAMFVGLQNSIQDIQKKHYLTWVIFQSSKPGVFVAGADIHELKNVKSIKQGQELIERGQRLFNQIESLKANTVAFIDGVALGGGLELSLACDYIVITNSDKVRVGLPEVNLGIIPGWGGTQRLPRRLGLLKGVQAIVTGQSFSGSKALRMGLVDARVSEAFAKEGLLSLIQSKKLKSRHQSRQWRFRLPLVQYMVKRQIRKSILAKTKGHYPAPLVALDVVFRSYFSSISKGLEIEKQAILDLLDTPIPHNLMSLFFAQENVKKHPILQSSSNQTLQDVGVIGAGLMGGGIGWWFLNAGQSVRLKDITWDMVAKGYQTIQALIKKGVERRKVSSSTAKAMMGQLSSTLEYNGFHASDLVIEAVPERMDIKKEVFKDIEANVSDQTIIATNTSSLCVDDMASVLREPGRFLGIHFFSPVHKMPLVELIPSNKTNQRVLADAYKWVIKNKKFPIIVQNCPGFLINRILLPYVNEAIHLMLHGYKIADIDAIAVDFGMPIGPLALADEVGLDIGLHVLKILESGYGQRMAVPESFENWVTQTQLYGKKSKKGFYCYGASVQPNNALYSAHSIVMKYRISDQDRHEIMDRLILVMLNEASRCLDEGVVESAEMLDLAMIMGTGFPPFRGGLLRYADQRGLGEIVQRLNHLAQTVNQRFKPSSMLIKLSQENQTFYR